MPGRRRQKLRAAGLGVGPRKQRHIGALRDGGVPTEHPNTKSLPDKHGRDLHIACLATLRTVSTAKGCKFVLGLFFAFFLFLTPIFVCFRFSSWPAKCPILQHCLTKFTFFCTSLSTSPASFQRVLPTSQGKSWGCPPFNDVPIGVQLNLC